MGAWGHDTFDNDAACDWTYELAGCNDLSVIRETLSRTLACRDECLDADEASEALGACDALARLRGNFGVRNFSTEPVDHWAAAHADLETEELLPLAWQVVDRVVADDSELAELWKESDSWSDWRAALEDLRSRLK